MLGGSPLLSSPGELADPGLFFLVLTEPHAAPPRADWRCPLMPGILSEEGSPWKGKPGPTKAVEMTAAPVRPETQCSLCGLPGGAPAPVCNG